MKFKKVVSKLQAKNLSEEKMIEGLKYLVDIMVGNEELKEIKIKAIYKRVNGELVFSNSYALTGLLVDEEEFDSDYGTDEDEEEVSDDE